MQSTNATPNKKSVRQPVGTNHFQFRDHQPLRGGCAVVGGGVCGNGGGVGSIGRFVKIDIGQVEQFTLRGMSLYFLGKSPRNEKSNPNMPRAAFV